MDLLTDRVEFIKHIKHVVIAMHLVYEDAKLNILKKDHLLPLATLISNLLVGGIRHHQFETSATSNLTAISTENSTKSKSSISTSNININAVQVFCHVPFREDYLDHYLRDWGSDLHINHNHLMAYKILPDNNQRSHASAAFCIHQDIHSDFDVLINKLWLEPPADIHRWLLDVIRQPSPSMSTTTADQSIGKQNTNMHSTKSSTLFPCRRNDLKKPYPLLEILQSLQSAPVNSVASCADPKAIFCQQTRKVCLFYDILSGYTCYCCTYNHDSNQVTNDQLHSTASANIDNCNTNKNVCDSLHVSRKQISIWNARAEMYPVFNPSWSQSNSGHDCIHRRPPHCIHEIIGKDFKSIACNQSDAALEACDALVVSMVRERFTKESIDSLPFGVAIPIRESLRVAHASNQPRGTSYKFVDILFQITCLCTLINL
jgi:hypothetical protein